MRGAGPQGELAQPHASDYARAVIQPVYIHGLPGSPRELDLPDYHFHPLKGREAGRYSLRVTGN